MKTKLAIFILICSGILISQSIDSPAVGGSGGGGGGDSVYVNTSAATNADLTDSASVSWSNAGGSPNAISATVVNSSIDATKIDLTDDYTWTGVHSFSSFQTGDGTIPGYHSFVELTANGSNFFRLIGDPDQASTGCAIMPDDGTPGDDELFIFTAATQVIDSLTCREIDSISIPACNTSTEKLHYDTATNTFSCQTDSTGGGGGAVACETTTLSSAQILALHTTDVSVRPAQGAGVVFTPTRIAVYYDRGTTNYSGGGNFTFWFDNRTTGVQINLSTTLSASLITTPPADQMGFSAVSGVSAGAASILKNSAIVIATGVAFTGGDGTLDVEICGINFTDPS